MTCIQMCRFGEFFEKSHLWNGVVRHDHQSELQVHGSHQIEAPQYTAKTTQEPLCECPSVGHPQPNLNPVLE